METENPDIRIAYLQRGNILVGIFRKDGMHCFMDNAYVIRRWGTPARGIGQIVLEGPTAETILDRVNGTVEWHELTGIFTIKCTVDKWREVIFKTT